MQRAIAITEAPRAERLESRRRAGSRVLLTVRDRELLGFLVRYRFATQAQISRRFDLSWHRAYKRLGRLRDGGFLEYRRIWAEQPGVFRPTVKGLAASDLALSAPRVDLRTYFHDLGVVDLGTERELVDAIVLTDREIRHAAGHSDLDASRYAIGLGINPRRFHLPDLVAIDGAGRIEAVELERAEKTIGRLREILEAYRRAPWLDQLTYYVARPVVYDRLDRLAGELLIRDRVELRRWPQAEELRDVA